MDLSDFCSGVCPDPLLIHRAEAWAASNDRFYDVDGGELDDLVHDYLNCTSRRRCKPRVIGSHPLPNKHEATSKATCAADCSAAVDAATVRDCEGE